MGELDEAALFGMRIALAFQSEARHEWFGGGGRGHETSADTEVCGLRWALARFFQGDSKPVEVVRQ